MPARAPDNEDYLQLAEAPQVPDLRFRRFRGESDYPAIISVIEGTMDVDRLETAISVEDLAREFMHLENCDPFRDFIFAEVGGRVVGYTDVSWALDMSGTYIYRQFADVLPEWRGTRIRNAMLRHNERVLRDMARSHPSEAPRFYQSFIEDTEKDWVSVLESEGYNVHRYALMLVRPDLEDIPDAKFPPGIEVRDVKPEHYRPVIDAWNEACKDMRGAVPISEERFKAWREDPSFDPSLWRIAWYGDEVIGTVMNFIDPEDNKKYNRLRGHPEMISVRRAWRKKGVATALIATSLGALKERGMTEAALGVDAENPSGARQLYEKLGFRIAKRYVLYRKPMD